MEQLPDTPWHVGYTKKKENDPRRHKSRCVYNQGGICRSTRSYYCLQACGGSSHCGSYKEKDGNDAQRIEQKNLEEKKRQDRVSKYKTNLEGKKRKLARMDHAYSYKPSSVLRKCLVCGESLRGVVYSLKECPYCGMYYVDIQDSTQTKVLDVVKASEIFLMNLKK